jgi:hypothetical protein
MPGDMHKRKERIKGKNKRELKRENQLLRNEIITRQIFS